MRYLLNSAVITAPGTYTYELVNAETATRFLEGKWESTIGYTETADALESIVGVFIPVKRKIITMEKGDKALVFRLKFPPGTNRVEHQEKGKMGFHFIVKNSEIGILSRIA